MQEQGHYANEADYDKPEEPVKSGECDHRACNIVSRTTHVHRDGSKHWVAKFDCGNERVVYVPFGHRWTNLAMPDNMPCGAI